MIQRSVADPIVDLRKIDPRKIDKIAEENPDLPREFIKNILISSREAHEGHLEKFSYSAQK